MRILAFFVGGSFRKKLFQKKLDLDRGCQKTLPPVADGQRGGRRVNTTGRGVVFR